MKNSDEYKEFVTEQLDECFLSYRESVKQHLSKFGPENLDKVLNKIEADIKNILVQNYIHDYSNMYDKWDKETRSLYIRNEEKKQDYKWLLLKFLGYAVTIICIGFVYKYFGLSPFLNPNS